MTKYYRISELEQLFADVFDTTNGLDSFVTDRDLSYVYKTSAGVTEFTPDSIWTDESTQVFYDKAFGNVTVNGVLTVDGDGTATTLTSTEDTITVNKRVSIQPAVAASNAVRMDQLGDFGGGDIVGPGSAVDGQIVLFDGVTGRMVKDSGFTPSSFTNLSTGGLSRVVSNTTFNDTLFVFCGDSTTELAIFSQGMFDRLLYLASEGGVLEGSAGFVNYGGSGYTLDGFVNDAFDPAFVGAVDGDPTWDYEGNKPAGAVNLWNALSENQARIGDVFVLCYGINDLILYDLGNDTEDIIVDTLKPLLEEAIQRIKHYAPDATIVLRTPNAMTARPLAVGFPTLSGWGVDEATDKITVAKWNTALRRLYTEVSHEYSYTVLFDYQRDAGGLGNVEVDSTDNPLLTDLVHPNGMGYSIMADGLVETLQGLTEGTSEARARAAEEWSDEESIDPWVTYPRYLEHRDSEYEQVYEGRTTSSGAWGIDISCVYDDFLAYELVDNEYYMQFNDGACVQVDHTGVSELTATTVRILGAFVPAEFQGVSCKIKLFKRRYELVIDPTITYDTVSPGKVIDTKFVKIASFTSTSPTGKIAGRISVVGSDDVDANLYYSIGRNTTYFKNELEAYGLSAGLDSRNLQFYYVRVGDVITLYLSYDYDYDYEIFSSRNNVFTKTNFDVEMHEDEIVDVITPNDYSETTTMKEVIEQIDSWDKLKIAIESEAPTSAEIVVFLSDNIDVPAGITITTTKQVRIHGGGVNFLGSCTLNLASPLFIYGDGSVTTIDSTFTLSSAPIYFRNIATGSKTLTGSGSYIGYEAYTGTLAGDYVQQYWDNTSDPAYTTLDSSTGTDTVGTEAVHVCNSASGYVLTLPAHISGRQVRIINKNTGVVTLSPMGAPTGGTIKGSATETLNQWESLILISDGTDWV